MSVDAAKAASDAFPASAIAQAFVATRRDGRALAAYPGRIPADTVQAYACQEAAISLWPDDIVGWKIGLVPPEFEAALGERRLAGPIFRHSVRLAYETAPPTPFPVFAGGFAAVEAEYVFEIAGDVPPEKFVWTEDEARAVASGLFIGVELAGSPLATINALGPTVVISDFGNNAGLIVGAPIKGWRGTPAENLRCETHIDGACVGRGSASSLPGGPYEALRWLLEHFARRQRPLRAGQLVSTGAVTGVHDIVAGQSAVVDFGRHGAIRCMATENHHTQQSGRESGS